MPDTLLRIDRADPESAPLSDKHTASRGPQQPGGGRREAAPPAPLELTSRKKRFTTDGGHRTVSPEETLANYAHLINPLTGIVRRLVPLVPAPNGLIHAYGAVYQTPPAGPPPLRHGGLETAGGKGKTDVQARTSALCEALERYSRIYQGYEPVRRASYKDLGEAAVHPNACMNFSARQYQHREALNAARTTPKDWIPAPFDESADIAWTPAWSLTHETFKYVPTAYCYARYRGPGHAFCVADANGNAAGNTLEEAIVQGFLELAERDSVALWWYNRVRAPAVDLQSFGEPYFLDLQAYFRSLGRALWVLDLTTDLGIPVFAALSRRQDKPQEDILFGFGAHFDAQLGIQRALTELNHFIPATLRIEHGHATPEEALDGPTRRWWREATLANQPYLAPHPTCPPKTASDYPPCRHDDLLDDVRLCARSVERRGMDMLVLDQTRPEIGLNVVKVMTPGLRHCWRRLGPGRLYDVPPQLGWRQEPLQEHLVNPVPMVF